MECVCLCLRVLKLVSPLSDWYLPMNFRNFRHTNRNCRQLPCLPFTTVTRALGRHQLLSMIHILDSCPTPRQAASQNYPLQFMTNFAGLVLDAEIGELLKHRHLLKRPQYKDNWGYSFGNKIGQLAQGLPGGNNVTDRLFFIDKK
jgi:hypothetical protein